MRVRTRQYPAGTTVHIVHRGVERRQVFMNDVDRSRFLEELRRAAARYSVDIHAYVLMGNHFHLLATPRLDRGVSWMIRDTCRRFVPAHNRLVDRVGTLWDGRHWSAVIDTDRYLLACSRYIELNPVRAGIIRHPGGYHWSSHAHNAFGKPDPLVTHHPSYCALATDDASRQEAYARLFVPAAVDRPEASIEQRKLREMLRARPNLNC